LLFGDNFLVHLSIVLIFFFDFRDKF
jgi:hypothetical protein